MIEDPENIARLSRLLTAASTARLKVEKAIEARDPPGMQLENLGGIDVRLARGLIGWSSVTLSRKARVDYAALVRVQSKNGVLPSNMSYMVRRAFEIAWVTFYLIGPSHEPFDGNR